MRMTLESPETPKAGILFEMRMRSDAQAVPGARRAARQICEDAGFPSDECAALDLALGEALTNAVRHGKEPLSSSVKNTEPGDVHLSVWDYQSRLIVQVHDCGQGFDPPLPPYEMPSPDIDATHGRGLPMMELLTDALVVCRGDATEGGSSVFLVKNLAPDAS